MGPGRAEPPGDADSDSLEPRRDQWGSTEQRAQRDVGCEVGLRPLTALKPVDDTDIGGRAQQAPTLNSTRQIGQGPRCGAAPLQLNISIVPLQLAQRNSLVRKTSEGANWMSQEDTAE
ncbi:hypothetical protein NDU88_001853 [Pleurodeles waltl]|uniref:Uncharacterized protein n=1 Tax=Pleurodeles waltl TaxID=8319 RepID=A0AAV7NCB4_PLEWA|nr:hypothetical protein NDU88_001853 [Pleurodeles waltl]